MPRRYLSVRGHADQATIDAFVAHVRQAGPAVVNVRQYIVNGRVELPPTVAYCGRRNGYYRLPESPWHNPYRGYGPGEDDPVTRFERYARGRLAKEPRWLEPLRGKQVLACWCSPPAPPERCHCSVLVRLLREFS